MVSDDSPSGLRDASGDLEVAVKEPFKYLIERTTPLGRIVRLRRQQQLRRKYVAWQRAGGGTTMPNYGKQQVVIDHIKRSGVSIFIETGTYKGKMVYAIQPHISEIHSIELDKTHWLNACRRFAGYPNIHIHHGQSGRVLPRLIADIDRPCLFWLDAHFSGGSTARGDLYTPIMQEIECIMSHRLADTHVILIDDARLFTGADDYPRIESLRDYIQKNRPQWHFEVAGDIIRTYCPAALSD